MTFETPQKSLVFTPARNPDEGYDTPMIFGWVIAIIAVVGIYVYQIVSKVEKSQEKCLNKGGSYTTELTWKNGLPLIKSECTLPDGTVEVKYHAVQTDDGFKDPEGSVPDPEEDDGDPGLPAPVPPEA